jgi:hypothetical protein
MLFVGRAVAQVEPAVRAGDLVLVVTLVTQLSSQVVSLAGATSVVGGSVRTAERLVWLRRHAVGDAKEMAPAISTRRSSCPKGSGSTGSTSSTRGPRPKCSKTLTCCYRQAPWSP